MTLIEHLAELRKRIFIILIVALVSSIIAYSFVDKLILELLKFAEKMDMVYLSPQELFVASIKISIVSGILISSPLIFYQIWLFIKPALLKREKALILISLYSGAIFFLIGITFAYKVIIPLTIEFFLKFQINEIKPMISFENYINFISSIIFSFGLVFEMPIISIILTRFNLITPEFLKNNRKIVILLIFILAAILTPPDVISQILLAIPMLLLYELSIILSSVFRKRMMAILATKGN